jgi:formylmethanofuran dehydrogenase subunit E
MGMMRIAVAGLAALMTLGGPARAETPEEWVALGARVHGGFGAFIPLGIRIGLDAAEKIKVPPRQLSITYYDNPRAPCACFADGVAIATRASFGQRTLKLADEPAPADKAAVIVIRPRQGGPGLRYSIPMSALPRLVEMNEKLDPLGRYNAVMSAEPLFEIATAP